MIGLREDIFIKIINNSKDNKFAKLSSPAKAFFDRVRQGENPEYGCLPCFDVDENPEFFSLEIFESLVTNKNNDLVTVKDAIDDLRSSKIKKSTYVESLNNTFSNPNQNACDKSFNHEKRLNNPKVRARFRIYQIMTKLNKKEFYEVSKYLKTGGESGISITTLKLMQAHWILDLDGNVNPRPEKHQLIQLLKNLNTKKQTQRALLANLPAPAALSIPDDACHYHESIDCQRTLTVREMARIQSFPDWYKIRSKVTTGGKMRKFEVPQYTQIGNAVPPLLGLALGKVCQKLINLSEEKF
jgi:DNA (cytosine-5)-methyltransferase 1